MFVLQAWLDAFSYYGDLGFWVFVMAGVIVGLVFGVIPGIGGILACALFLPFVFVLSPALAMGFIVAVQSVVHTGDAISAVLIGVPGTGVAAATLLDGFPMTQKGQGGRALGAALSASTFGGIIAGLWALMMIPLILPLVFAVNASDMFFVIVTGLLFIGVLAAGSPFKGLISGGLGILISFIGFQAVSGVARLNFGSSYLYDGIPLIPVTLGAFGLPITIRLLGGGAGGTIATEAVTTKMKDVWQGTLDVFRHFWLFIRCTLIGYIIGVLPGVGSGTAIWMCYGHARQTSKYPEKFGTGVVEGVIAPECANNANESGALLITLALGVPGGSAQVLTLAALMMLGITPGPVMMKERLDLTLALLYLVVVASILGAIICYLFAPQMVKITHIPLRIMFPLIVVLIFVGTFAFRGYFLDILMLLCLTALGMALRQFGYNLPAYVLGYVMGEVVERSFFAALQTGGPLFFAGRPISITLMLLGVLLFTYGPISRGFKRLLARI